MNLHRKERGVDKTIGNLLHAIPDAEEYQDRLHACCDAASKHLSDWMEATRKQKVAYLALVADFQLLADEIRRADGVVRSWKDDINEGAADLALTMPTLGFRVVKDLPQGGIA